MSAPLTLYLLRHGEVHNPDRVLYGRLPGYGLSENGRKQAIAAGKHLANTPLAALYASPMQRAQETAQLINAQRSKPLTIQTDERITEVHSPYEGQPHAVLEPIVFDLYTGTEPPYEQPRDLLRRTLSFVNEMRRKHARQAIAAVSHGDIVVAMFMYAKGQDANNIGRSRLDPSRNDLPGLGLPERYPMTASISTLRFMTADPDERPEYSYLRPY